MSTLLNVRCSCFGTLLATSSHQAARHWGFCWGSCTSRFSRDNTRLQTTLEKGHSKDRCNPVSKGPLHKRRNAHDVCSAMIVMHWYPGMYLTFLSKWDQFGTCGVNLGIVCYMPNVWSSFHPPSISKLRSLAHQAWATLDPEGDELLYLDRCCDSHPDGADPITIM
jgi:hypothetical protein